MSKRLASAIFALLFALTAFVPALAAAETPAPSGAPEAEPSEKEEVIYFNLDASGEVESAYAVNSFPGGDIRDYGDYSGVRVLNTSDEITLDGDEVRLSSDAAKVYYQGTLKDPRLPWDISLTYKLDGKALSPEELGGKSGSLEIRFTVEKNDRCAGSFYEDYALQASFTMPGECCSGVSAPDATVANVGADKQLTFTLLPGEGIDTVISAEVEDFTMPAVSINGVHLNLSVDVDTEDIKDQVGQLVSAAAQLDNGAAALASGSGALLDGTAGLRDGAESLTSGIESLDSGVGELQSGLAAMQAGLSELSAKSPELTGGAARLAAGLNELSAELAAFDVNAEIASMLAAVAPQIEALTGAGAEARSAAETLKGGVSGLVGEAMSAYMQISAAVEANTAAEGVIDAVLADEDIAAALAEKGYNLGSVKAALQGSSAVMNGVVTTVSGALGSFSGSISALETALNNLDTAAGGLTTAISGLQAQAGAIGAKVERLKSGVAALTAGAAELSGGAGAYASGVTQLLGGFGSVMSGVGALAEGTGELLAGAGELNSGTSELYGAVAALCEGAESMAAGAGELHSSAGSEDVQAQVDELLGEIGGSMDAPESFVSAENGVISSVQFVIQSEAVEAAEAEPEPEPPAEEPTLWQRFLALFGL